MVFQVLCYNGLKVIFISGYKKLQLICQHLDEINNNLGVPQGSVLGRVLFIIYLNDISYVPGTHKLNLFADDTLLYVTGVNLAQVVQSINNSLINIQQYLRNNKLKLNASKTKAMIITTPYKHKLIDLDTIIIIEIDGVKIELVNEIKYLGFIIDKYLSLNNHAEYVIKKISKKLYFFSRVSNDLSMFARITCFNCIIQPHFDYCASVMF